MRLKLCNVTNGFFRGQMPSDKRSADITDNDCFTRVNLEVNPGRCCCITGPSGTGKTNLLKIAAGVLKPIAGEVFIDDVNLYEADESTKKMYRKKTIGFIPQTDLLLNNVDVYDNMAFALSMAGEQLEEDSIIGTLKDLELENVAHSYPSQLTQSEYRRAVFAKTFVTKPDVLIADEIPGYINRESRNLINMRIKEYANEHVVLVATKNPELIASDNIDIVPIAV